MDEAQCPPSRVETGQQGRIEGWHPKLAPYRLLVTALTIGLGTAKAVTSASDGGSAISVTTEWIAGIVVLLVTFFLNNHETNDSAKPHWLFKSDAIDGIRNLGVPIPIYDTEEHSSYLIRPKKPPVTGYRILVSVSAISFGMAKALLSYRGLDAAPTAVEWVYGVVVTVSLYWLGMYEKNSSGVMPWLFVIDHSQRVHSFAFAVGFIAVHLVALYAAYWWTSLWYGGVKDMMLSGWSDPNLSSSEAFFSNIFVLMWLTMAIGMGIGGGVAAACVVLVSLGSLLVPRSIIVARTCLRVVKRISGRAQDDFDDEATLVDIGDFNRTRNWIGRLSWPSVRFSTPGGETWKQIFRILPLIGFAILYTLAHGVAFIIAFGWTMMWLYGLRALWNQGPDSFFLWAFTLFWSTGACIAMVVGSGGTIAVVLSFFSGTYHGRRFLFSDL